MAQKEAEIGPEDSLVRPFRGVRYDPDKVGDVSHVCAPPYDVISPEERRRLEETSPYNSVRLVLPDANGPEEGASGVAQLLRQWLDAGILVPDPFPSLYPYTMRYVHPLYGPSSITGVIAAISLRRPEAIYPHEATLPGPLVGQLALLRATRANLSPIYVLAEGVDLELEEILSSCAQRPTVCRQNGVEHSFDVIGDPQSVRRIQEALSGSEFFIADGHHRYEVAKRFYAADGGKGSDAVMALIVAVQDARRALLGTHRVVTTADEATLVSIKERFEQEFGPCQPARYDEELIEPLLAEGNIAAAFAGQSSSGQSPALLYTRPQGDASNTSAEAIYRALPVVRLHERVLEGVEAGCIDFEPSVQSALESLEKGTAKAVFFLPPPSVDTVCRLARAGVKLPQKTTYFYPKPRTGAVFRLMDLD